MATKIHQFKATQIASLCKTPGKHADGGGLFLQVSDPYANKGENYRAMHPGLVCGASWLLRYRGPQGDRAMGLGNVRDVTLAEARELADKARRLVAKGLDPMEERRRIAAEAARAAVIVPTLGDYAEAWIAANESGWKNPKHAAIWRTCFTRYLADLSTKRVNEIATADVIKALTPIWVNLPTTGARVRAKLEFILNAAKVAGHRSGDNPAAWGENLKFLMPKNLRRKQRVSHPSLPFAQVPAFMARLRTLDIPSARLLELTILTGVRTSEALGARVGEFDMDAKLWKIPAERMKMNVEFWVPLSQQVIDLLDGRLEGRGTDLVFPGMKRGKPYSTNAMKKVLDALDVQCTFTVHGFRSSMRTWGKAQVLPGTKIKLYTFDTLEAALAHQVGDDVTRAYDRDDDLEARRPLMEGWAAYLAGAEVVELDQMRKAG